MKTSKIVYQRKSDPERREKQALKYARILTIAKMIDVSGPVVKKEIQKVIDKFGYTERTVWRDIAAIRRSIEIMNEREGTEL